MNTTGKAKAVRSHQIPTLAEKYVAEKQHEIIQVSYGDINKLKKFLTGVDNFLTVINSSNRAKSNILFKNITKREPPMSADGGDSKVWEPVSVTRSQHLKYFKLDSATGERLKDATGNPTGELKDKYKKRCKVFDMKKMDANTTSGLSYVIPHAEREKMLQDWEEASAIVRMTLLSLFNDPDKILVSTFSDYELWEEIHEKLSNYKSQQINDTSNLMAHFNWKYKFGADFAINRQHFIRAVENVETAREAFYADNEATKAIRAAFDLTMQHEKIFILLKRLRWSNGPIMTKFFELQHKRIAELVEKLQEGTDTPKNIYQALCTMVIEHENQFGCDRKVPGSSHKRKHDQMAKSAIGGDRERNSPNRGT